MLVLITDAWHPQVNGVVTTYTNILNHLTIPYEVISPQNFKSIYNPFYPEIRLALPFGLKQKLLSYEPNTSFHIATEGPLGWRARSILNKAGRRYSTAFHTRFPEYCNVRFGIPVSWGYKFINKFHSTSSRVFVPSNEIAKEFSNRSTAVISRGYDTEYFYDDKKMERNSILYVGRLSKEKNIEAFCSLPYDNLVVVGDGPERKRLERRYKNVQFVGYKFGQILGNYYRQAKVTVFPSKTDTFGITLLEAMACGSPVASYNCNNTKNIIINELNGYRNDNLHFAVKKCLTMNNKSVAKSVTKYNWPEVAQEFQKWLV